MFGHAWTNGVRIYARMLSFVIAFFIGAATGGIAQAFDYVGFYLGMPLAEAEARAVELGTYLEPSELSGSFLVAGGNLDPGNNMTTLFFCDYGLARISIGETGSSNDVNNKVDYHLALFGEYKIVERSGHKEITWSKPGLSASIWMLAGNKVAPDGTFRGFIFTDYSRPDASAC